MWRNIQMAAGRSVRRVQNLSDALSLGRGGGYFIRFCTTSSQDKVVAIGDVSMKISTPKHPELVPVRYLPGDKVPQSLMRHLRWIMQKDLLGQDVFLIGPPGPLRRNVAMMYLELTKKEAEYVSLSRDTTETDLKQRREIKSGTAFHIDQCAVRAATEGRILILEGIEKAERNVLPVLNNLLENREMQLDDGRFLMAAKRYDQLLEEHTEKEMKEWNIVRVDENFRVIALGLPVPRYQGNPLDPPLRSRFQARDINPLPFKDHLDMLSAVGGGLGPERITQILSFASTMKSDEASTLGLPDFPLDNLSAAIQILNSVPSASVENVLEMLYPHDIMIGKEGQTAVTDALKKFELLDQGPADRGDMITEVRRSPEGASVQVQCNGRNSNVKVNSGTLEQGMLSENFVNTPYHDQLLSQMMLAHMVKDFCIIGPRGCGKSVLIKQFADLLGYHIEPIMLYQDMTSRDLLQQRMTLPNGDTTWRPSPLVKAALDGSLAVLDGVHRVNNGTFAVLNRLIHDRELTLFDGTRLLRRDRYDKHKETLECTDEEMADKGIFPIHPSFRMLAVSEPPVVGSSTQQWLSSEVLTMFMFINMRPLSKHEELNVLHKLVPNMTHMQSVMELTHKLRESHDSNLKSVATSLSTRNLLRIARRLAEYPNEDVYHSLHKASLARFLPRLAKTAFEEELEQFEISKPAVPDTEEGLEKSLTCEVKGDTLRIGNTMVPIYNPENRMKVPDVLFYENPQHLSVMEDMLKDYLLGEHLLLVGNQGVGKNKIIDRFLYLLNRPREYLQLHRDTTVQTLTLQPTVQDGVIKFEDSPLVRAVKNGHILVVDEADKAPTAVTCIVKTLVESGEMHLADGRRIVSARSGIAPSESVIVAHPDFRMFVLANRPGFPFLGNDFFGAMGDIFSCHAVDNPDMESEMSMLKQYGPDVPEEILKKLVLAFGELRDMADQGLINYPYSTREVVNMVRHLQLFPNEGLASVVKNVFDFDMYNKEVTETIVDTLHKHGIPVGANPNNILLAKEFPLPKFENVGTWTIQKQGLRKKTGLMSLPVEDKTLRFKGPVRLNPHTYNLDKTEARSTLFTEQEAFWNIPMHETSKIIQTAVTKGTQRQPGRINDDIIHIATVSPISMYSMNPSKQHLTCIDLYDVFPTTRSNVYRPKITLAPLGFPLDQNVVLHEELSNIVLSINFETGEVSRLETTTLLEAATESLTRSFRSTQGGFKMCGDFAHESDGMLLFYKIDGQEVDVVNMLEGRCHSISLPLKVANIQMTSRYDWLITESNTQQKYLLSNSEDKPFDYYLQSIQDTQMGSEDRIDLVATSPLHESLLSGALNQKMKSPNRLLATKDTYATLAVGLPELGTVDMYCVSRERQDNKDLDDRMKGFMSTSSPARRSVPDPTVYLPDSGQVVRALPVWNVPSEVYPQGVKPKNLCGYLEVTDVVSKNLRYIPIPGVTNHNIYNQWYGASTDCQVVMAPMKNDGLVTVDAGGAVRLWETTLFNLDKSVQKWRGLIGDAEFRDLEISERASTTELEEPKHGRVDPTGNPHVGGGTWAGGTGGSNTAGLGGIGGPYRLDAGHDVTQVPDWQKQMVPQEVQQAAREMAEKAFKERLKQIKMSEYDGELYDTYLKAVKGQVKSIRIILDTLQAKGKERQWLKHQAYGDLDEAKLIEGLTGEKAIYKRRGEKEPELGSPQQKPKLMKLLCDVSGSMYRFNGYDGRLEREMEAMLMVMEAFEGYDQKLKYEIIGHSGDGYKFDIVKGDKPPKNNKERMDVLKTLHAHSQFCISGDHTLEATQHAIKTITDTEADEHFVIVLSDANLDRYGIRPKHLSDILTSNDDVNAYVIFIGSLGDQASRLLKQMPSGRAFLCLDTKNLPQILQQIFTSTMLNTR